MLDKFLTQQLTAIDGVDVDPTASFADLTTLRVGGKPRVTLRCSLPEAAVAALRYLEKEKVPFIVVGGGSNLLVSDGEVDVVAVVLDFAAVDMDTETGLVRAQAGAVWDEVVAESVTQSLGGIECLSGIPGTVGAVPVQNVGAYGAEISEVLTRVRLYNLRTDADEWVPVSDLDLAYRYSNLKFTGRAVVLEVELQLTTDGLSRPLRFGQLTDAPGERRPVAQVREEVLALRRGKGMVLDPTDHDTWSAGSFFTNPVVDSALADAVQAKVRASLGDATADSMPRHPSSEADREKLSAAWLIDRAGFAKGYPGSGRATLSTNHRLALTNRGEATAADIVDLARTIRDGVRDAFGVELVPEPVWIGLALDE
ncbi:UDP-N-acetylmuramate dehydrogenase, partial [uncultured Corynebacterium sp.]|uniref:UDP-N-acetylmuramate dehydrogenase n=1 Tax=uncultured Corynebacterium sp. TaxID=159447 RepID=UPI002621AE74